MSDCYTILNQSKNARKAMCTYQSHPDPPFSNLDAESNAVFASLTHSLTHSLTFSRNSAMPVSAGPLENLTALSSPYKVMLDLPLAKFHSLTTWQMITHRIRAEVTTPEPKANQTRSRSLNQKLSLARTHTYSPTKCQPPHVSVPQ